MERHQNLPPCPVGPHWNVDWEALSAAYPWIEALKDVPQDPIYHAEGDAWTHVGMVCKAMAALPAWRARPEEERAVLFAAALLHDVAKPYTTVIEGDRVRSPHHASKGAIIAREVLWRMGVPMRLREQVAALVRNHMKPFWVIEQDDPARSAIRISQTTRCDHLAILATADAKGRICPDEARLHENIALFVAVCEEQDCLKSPRAFPSDHTRFVYFRQQGRNPDIEAYDDTRGEAVLMSGLPGAGKDTWVRTHCEGWPVISLDALRQKLGVKPTQTQGAVISAAREQAREHLRVGQRFVWNATNISRSLRSRLIDIFSGYNAQIRIVHIDTPAATLYRQNKQREAIVPPHVIDGMVRKWEVPDLTEAHRVQWVAN